MHTGDGPDEEVIKLCAVPWPCVRYASGGTAVHHTVATEGHTPYHRTPLNPLRLTGFQGGKQIAGRQSDDSDHYLGAICQVIAEMASYAAANSSVSDDVLCHGMLRRQRI